MTSAAFSFQPSSLAFAANDDAASSDLVGPHLAARRMQRRIVLGVAVLAALVLASTMLHAYQVMRELPDLVTYAFRV